MITNDNFTLNDLKLLSIFIAIGGATASELV